MVTAQKPSVLSPDACVFTVRLPSPPERIFKPIQTFSRTDSRCRVKGFYSLGFGNPSCKMHQTGAHRFACLKVLPGEIAKPKVRRHHGLLTAAERWKPAPQRN